MRTEASRREVVVMQARRSIAAVVALAALLCVPGAALAQAVCAPGDVDRYQLLRRLSLDLRGRVPTVEEYMSLDAREDVPPELVKDWIGSDDFRVQVRRYHEAMFWPNLSRVRLNDTNVQLGQLAAAAPFFVTSSGRQTLYRNVADNSCGDFEQTNFDPAYPGEFRPDPAFVVTEVVNNVNVRREGWRMVTPYWSATPVKVCAYDAQESAAATTPQGASVSCNGPRGLAAQGCGCGPGLKWCYGPGASVQRPILEALREQLGRAVDAVAAGGKPYTELLVGTNASVNGPLAFWRRNLAAFASFVQTYNAPDPGEDVPDKAFTDATWTDAPRSGLHAGVLTLPGYLLRFQTDRGRANRFRINFLCSAFVPPPKLESASSGVCSDTAEDITQRCNCRYCHSILEPLAAHWGLFAEAGSTQLTDPSLFPKYNAGCRGSRTAFCQRFYVTRTDAHNAGALLPYQWSDAHPELVANLEGGPRLLAQQAIESGQLARCTVRKLYEHFLQAEMYPEDAPATPELDRLADGFVAAGWSLPWLVEQLVTLPQYRRAR